MIDFPNKFQKYKNCNSVFIFQKKDSKNYRVINKIKNGEFKFVKNYKCIVEKKNLLDFLNNNVYH